MANITLKGLRKEFGDVIAVEHLDLEIEDREVICLLGPSGCGKTTTLNCIAGLEKPTKGQIYFDDVSVTAMLPKDRGIGLVFQSYALFQHMTARENLAFPLRIRKAPREEMEKEVAEVSRFLGLDEVLDRKAGKLHLNEMQRIAIGRTLLSKPKILLLDEPLSALDAQTRVYMRGELKRVIKDTQQTTIYVTHDQVEAMALADRIAVMSKGLLQQYGTPQEVYHQPKNKFVANFIGSPSINFIRCSYVEKDDTAVLTHDAFQYNVTEHRRLIAERGSGSELTLGIRPEHVYIVEETSKDAIPATVYAVEPLGAETLLDLQLGEDIIRLSTPRVVKTEMGERIHIAFDRAAIHIFDDQTDAAIV